jgi:23S rRNA-/tRNA-specific pseudouridylate synthase
MIRPTALPIPQLWKFIHQAADGNKGVMASILNAWIAGCCFSFPDPNDINGQQYKSYHYQDNQYAYEYAFDLFRYATTTNHVMVVTPDLVTYSLLQSGCPDSESSPNNRRDILWTEAQKQQRRQQRGSHNSRRRRRVDFQKHAHPSSAAAAGDSIQRLQKILGSDFAVLYENEDWVVINKPAGVSCSHKHTTTAGKIPKTPTHEQNGNKNNFKDISLEDALVAAGWSLSTWNPEVRGLVHRLDRGTSGCMAWAKHDSAHAQLVVDWFLRRVRKTYQCIISPIPEKNINVNKQQDETHSTFHIDAPVHGKPARSEFRILRRFQYHADEKVSNQKERKMAALLEVQPYTGRKHQVRIHCARDLGCPVWGEDLHLYSNDNPTTSKQHTPKKQTNTKPVEKQNKRDQRFFLHASSLSIPYQQQTITVEAPLPTFWEPALTNWE